MENNLSLSEIILERVIRKYQSPGAILDYSKHKDVDKFDFTEYRHESTEVIYETMDEDLVYIARVDYIFEYELYGNFLNTAKESFPCLINIQVVANFINDELQKYDCIIKSIKLLEQ